jgi:hypothetical protein
MMGVFGTETPATMRVKYGSTTTILKTGIVTNEK